MVIVSPSTMGAIGPGATTTTIGIAISQWQDSERTVRWAIGPWSIGPGGPSPLGACRRNPGEAAVRVPDHEVGTHAARARAYAGAGMIAVIVVPAASRANLPYGDPELAMRVRDRDVLSPRGRRCSRRLGASAGRSFFAILHTHPTATTKRHVRPEALGGDVVFVRVR